MAAPNRRTGTGGGWGRRGEVQTISRVEDVVVPPDGGWGWVVVAACFLCNMVVDGIIFCGGALLEHIQKEFNVTSGQVAPVNSLLAGFYMLAGPFVSALTNKYGFRRVTILGSVIGSAAFAISYFATSVEYLYVTYGIIGGIGLCMIYMAAVLMPGFYFEKWRSLATGLALCGSGVGTFVLAPLNDFLLNELGWRVTLLVHAAFVLQCFLFGAMFRPIKPTKVIITTEEVLQGKPRQRGTSTEKPSSMLDLQSRLGLLRSPSTTIKVASDSQPTTAEANSSNISKLLLGNATATGKPTPVLPEPKKDEQNSNADNESKSRKSNDDLVSRPLDRDDIFFGASLTRLPEYTSTTSLGYHIAMTHVPTPPQEEKKSRCRCCPEAVRRILATMLDVSLFRSPTFVLLALGGFFTVLGLFVPFMYVKQRAESFNMDSSLSVMLVSSIGISNIVGRIACGLLSAFPKVSPLWVANVAMTAGGVATMLSGLSYKPAFQFSYCVIFGLALACFASLRSILAVKYIGLDKLTNCFGLFILFQGAGALMGSPIAGALMDYTKNYDLSFYMAGSFLLLSAVICYPVDCVNRWEKKRNKPSVNPRA